LSNHAERNFVKSRYELNLIYGQFRNAADENVKIRLLRRNTHKDVPEYRFKYSWKKKDNSNTYREYAGKYRCNLIPECYLGQIVL